MKQLIKNLAIGASIVTSTSLLANDDLFSLDAITISSKSEDENKHIIKKEEISKFNNITIGDALRKIPGITFAGDPTNDTDIRLRGIDTKYTQILINGERVSSSGENREFETDLIPISMIERVEVIKTPTADIDSQGIAGTINIILKDTPKTKKLVTKLGVTKVGDHTIKPNANITYGDKIDNLSFLLNVNAQKRNLTNDKVKRTYDDENKFDSRKIELENREFEEYSITGKFDLDINDNNKLTFTPTYTSSKENKVKTKTNYKETTFDGTETELRDKKRVNKGIDFKLSHILSDDTDLSFLLMAHESTNKLKKNKFEFDDAGDLDEAGVENESRKDRKTHYKVKGSTVVSDLHTLDYGIAYINKKRKKSKQELEIDSGGTTDVSSSQNQYSAKEDRVNSYIQDTFKINEKNSLTSGLRIEYSQYSANTQSGIKQKKDDTLFNPSFNYLYNIDKNNKIKIGLAQTVSRPSFDDLNPYIDTDDGTLKDPDKVGNPNLKPEISRGIDITYEHYLKDKKGFFSANVFYKNIKDKMQENTILNTQNNRYEKIMLNQGKETLRGLEIEGNYNLSEFIPNLIISTNITFMHGDIKDKTSGEKIPVSEMPDYVYNIGFSHKFTKNFEWGMNYNYEGKSEIVSIDTDARTHEYIKPQGRLDLYAKTKLNKTTSLNFSANNLLKVEKKTKTVSFENGNLDETEYEDETSERLFTVSLVSKF